jgi:hypothetical protein
MSSITEAYGTRGHTPSWVAGGSAQQGKRDLLRQLVQQMSTATYPPGTDLMRPKQALDLRQRPASTSLRLVHTEEVNAVTGSDPVRFGNAAIFIGEPLPPTAAVSTMARSWPPPQRRITVSV